MSVSAADASEGGRAGSDAGGDGSIDAASACPLPAGAETYSDASATGCVASPAYLMNGDADVCAKNTFTLSCYGVAAPASLLCSRVGVPPPQGVLVYCCPCAQ
jgi:hypothetical protein